MSTQDDNFSMFDGDGDGESWKGDSDGDIIPPEFSRYFVGKKPLNKEEEKEVSDKV